MISDNKFSHIETTALEQLLNDTRIGMRLLVQYAAPARPMVILATEAGQMRLELDRRSAASVASNPETCMHT